MTEQHLALILSLIADLVPGTRFTLRELLRDKWDAVHGGRPKLFGRQFADAVERGEVPGVVLHEVRVSGGQNVWRKL